MSGADLRILGRTGMIMRGHDHNVEAMNFHHRVSCLCCNPSLRGGLNRRQLLLATGIGAVGLSMGSPHDLLKIAR